ncbi:signal peptidase II [Aeromicrobium sp. CTD01-1L150]|uniref:signal peptidase II n=1 Tax=Aeromicrobium sp. CTD01-1L150 TaxID=3341830 RepID=UPI0035C1C2C8
MESDETHEGQSGQGRGALTGRLLLGVVLAYALDQATKVWAVARLEGEPSIEVVPGALSLTFLRNPGAAFGMGASLTVALSLVSVVVVVVVIKMASRLRDVGWTIGLGLLLAGALGNLTDRLLREPGVLRGHVVDFIDYGPFVGNVADIYLTFAAVVIIWRSFKGIGLDGSKGVS